MSSSKKKITRWIENVIIKQNICPFAKRPYESGKILLQESNAAQIDQIIMDFSIALEKVSTSKEQNSALIFYPKLKCSFEYFNDLKGECDQIIEDLNFHHDYQLVCFHSNFKFIDTHTDDRVNYVNRSPYPLLHILGFSEVEKVMQKYESIGLDINKINERYLNSLTDDEFNNLILKYLN